MHGLEEKIPYYGERFMVKPGITGWAQVNGRDELPDDTKVELDRWHCDNWNYFLDWRIIFSTFSAVLSKRGAF